MIECNAIIEANKEIDELKRINKKLNKVCIDYSFKMEKLEKENEELKKRNEYLKKRCDEYWEETGLNSDYFEWGLNYEILEKRIQL